MSRCTILDFKHHLFESDIRWLREILSFVKCVKYKEKIYWRGEV